MVRETVRIFLGVLLLGAAGTDLLWRRIPNGLIIAGLSAFAALAFCLHRQRDTALLISCLAAGTAAFALHLIPYLYKSMGAGDVKLASVIGLLLGWEGWLGYLTAYCAVAFTVSGLLLLAGKRKVKSLPLAPVMTAAYLLYCLHPFRFGS